MGRWDEGVSSHSKADGHAMATLPKPKSLSLQAIRAESRNRDLEEKIRQENKRNTLVLILRFLTDNR